MARNQHWYRVDRVDEHGMDESTVTKGIRPYALCEWLQMKIIDDVYDMDGRRDADYNLCRTE